MTPQELKNSILQLAIQGKLVEQRQEEGTADELYRQIQQEKQRLIKERKIKKEKPLPEIAEDEKAFDIPESWKLFRLGELITLLSGTDFPPERYNDKGIGTPYITGASSLHENGVLLNRWTETPSNIAECGDVLLVCKGSGYGKTVICNIDKAHIARQIMAIKNSSLLDMNYIRYYLQANLNLIKANGQGVIPGIDRNSVLNMVFALPPLTEQKRIVAKIEELLPLIDRYEKAWNRLEEFNKRFPDDMQKSILQMAIQGKLVEQKPKEENTTALVAACKADKSFSVQIGKIKKELFRGKIIDSNVIPFDIPDNWSWMFISDVTFFQEGPGILAVDFRTQGVPLIRIAGMQTDTVTLNGCNYLDPDMVALKWNHFRLDKGDIVISTSASMDKIAEVGDECVGAIPYTGLIRFKMYGGILKEYFKWFIKSPFYAKQIEEQEAGGTIKHYGPSHLRKMLIPIPPLEEQKRIVDKIEELLPLCQKLSMANK